MEHEMEAGVMSGYRVFDVADDCCECWASGSGFRAQGSAVNVFDVGVDFGSGFWASGF